MTNLRESCSDDEDKTLLLVSARTVFYRKERRMSCIYDMCSDFNESFGLWRVDSGGYSMI
jgi:hypothetical protein